ncbi:helix-turn-helix domain-containing protein [Actinomadura sp. 9N407]|uniref:helix-turn-helix domain-containing protein n=1 Tax=Actinomadura sp. 9N407 TaxID=3375154 RepID=UPI0037BBE183
MEFAGALRQAIQASGLTLERIRHRLALRGLTVSVASLSYWQRGRSRPRSRAVVLSLEEILQVQPGALTELLDDPVPAMNPGRGAVPAFPAVAGTGPGLWPDPERYARVVGQLDRSGDHRLERLSIHDLYHLGPDRRPYALTVREVLRATGDDIDRVVRVHPVAGPDPRLTGLRYCRSGRVRTEGGLGDGGSAGDGDLLMGVELVFDRVLAAGDTVVIEYELSRPAGDYERRFPRPVRDYLAVVQFHAETLPARCYGYARDDGGAPRRRLGELWIGASGSAHLALGDVRRGIVGIEWEWE